MNQPNFQDAFGLGSAAADQTMDHGEAVMNPEKRRIELTNEAPVVERKAQLKILSDERDDIRAFLRNVATPDLDLRARRRYYIIVAVVLLAGGVAFNHLAFQPFGFGRPAVLYAIAMALVCTALADVALEHFGSPRIVGLVALIGFATGLASLMILASVRADVFDMYLKTALAGGDSTAIRTSDAGQFYQSEIHHLQIVFTLIAVALELATGLLVWKAWRISTASITVLEQAKKRLAGVETRMAQLVGEIVALQNESEIVAAEFMRDFHIGAFHGMKRRNLARVGGVASLALLGLLSPTPSPAQPTFVIVPDMTRSTVVAKTSDGESEYKKNIDAAVNLVKQLPAGSTFTVIGITEASFATPLFLASGAIPSDPGPLEFLNRIDIARARYASQLKAAAAGLKVTAQKTDVIGAIFVASELLKNARGERNLIIISDARQSAKPLDIETPSIVPVKAALETIEHERLIPDLRRVNAWVLGVDAAQKDIAYVSSLREFWTVFFTKTGASLREFSKMRELPKFDKGQ